MPRARAGVLAACLVMVAAPHRGLAQRANDACIGARATLQLYDGTTCEAIERADAVCADDRDLCGPGSRQSEVVVLVARLEARHQLDAADAGMLLDGAQAVAREIAVLRGTVRARPRR